MTGGRDAEFLLFAREQRLVLLDLAAPPGQAAACQHLVGNFDEVLREETLSAIDIDDALVEHQVGRGRRRSRIAKCLLPALPF